MKRVKKAKTSPVVKAPSEGSTAFIALVCKETRLRDKRGHARHDRHGNYLYGDPAWYICGSDLHATIEKARACGCASNDPDKVGVLEVKIVAQHTAKLAFKKEDKITLKFNDK